MSMNAFLAVLAPAIVAVTAALAPLVSAFTRREAPVFYFTAVGLLAAFVGGLWIPDDAVRFGTLLVFDGYARFFMELFLLTGLFALLVSYRNIGGPASRRGEYYILMTLAVLGAMTLAASDHFASFVLGLELISISLFGLVAYRRTQAAAIEAGIKYFILAGVSSAILLFGMALMYTRTGTMHLSQLASTAGKGGGFMLGAGLTAVLVGTGFKLSLAPFHLWTPDVYRGAAPSVGGFVATVSKAAVFAVLLRTMFVVPLQHSLSFTLVLSLVAGASMFAGNLLALHQNNLQRLLAYSSIAHLGYLAIMLVVPTPLGGQAVAYYLVFYIAATLTAFGALAVMCGEEDRAINLDHVKGLVVRRPGVCTALTVSFLSLAGLPITAGFFGKFYVVLAGWAEDLRVLVYILIINSVLGLYYYLRVVGCMFQSGSDAVGDGKQEPASWATTVALVALTIVTVLAGVFPDVVIHLGRAASMGLDAVP